ncbi:very short patch repair endonuclease [Alcanivorax jadensis]|uniref:very short patch repair endonuclease n=1 Tax=Alcanivorax jadensis TaxID=64988 RepID=UPI0023521594|nr:very short patch repair endonuclease [Alcanivorax jadensis]
MADIVDPATRSRMMAGIRGKNTRPELLIRSALHKAGFRFRLHDRRLAGVPDIVLPKYEAVIFVNGCFWHRHSGCRYASTPSTRPEFWRVKFEENIQRDERNRRLLLDAGWRVFTIWECCLRHSPVIMIDELIRLLKAQGREGCELPRDPIIMPK